MNQQSVLYDVKALKIYSPLVADVVGGASATWSAGVALQGVANISLTPNMVTGELKGDGGMVLSRKGRTDRLMCSFTYGRLGLDALAIMLGGVSGDTGTGVSEIATWQIAMPNTLPFFRVECQIVDTDNGVADVHAIMYKCQLKSATFIDSKTDGFGQPKIDVEAIPLLCAAAGAPTGTIGNINMYAQQTALTT